MILAMKSTILLVVGVANFVAGVLCALTNIAFCQTLWIIAAIFLSSSAIVRELEKMNRDKK